jgi:hypothetical protein
MQDEKVLKTLEDISRKLDPKPLSQLGDELNYFECLYGQFDTCFLEYFSSTQPSDNQTDNYSGLTDAWDGFDNEFEKLGNAVWYKNGAGVVQTPNIIDNPYPSLLRCMNDWNYITKKINITLYKVQFVAYNAMQSGSAFQNAAVNTAVTNSLSSSVNDSLVQNRLHRTIPVDWQPNFFRPSIKINGGEVLNGIQETQDGSHKGIKSIGSHLPFSIIVKKTFKQISDIKVRAAVRQKVPVVGSTTDTYYLAYPVKAILMFVFGG